MKTKGDDTDPILAGDSGSANLIAHWKRMQEERSRATQTGAMPVPVTDVSATGVVGTGTVPLGELTLRGHGVASVVAQATGLSSAQAESDSIEAPPEVALAFALLDVGDRVADGQLIVAVTPAWERIISELGRDPNALYRLTPRQAEELVAGAYRSQDWQVTLTPRSADGGVDIIATRSDVGHIRILDQVKLYKPNHLVPAKDVREMCGVLDADRRASKAYVTTTSGFAPGVRREFADRMPTRLELRDGASLAEWLKACLIK